MTDDENSEGIYMTPSGLVVTILDVQKNGWYWMSNGSLIDQEILDSWKVHTKGEKHE